jgi:hypothetical protein
MSESDQVPPEARRCRVALRNWAATNSRASRKRYSIVTIAIPSDS